MAMAQGMWSAFILCCLADFMVSGLQVVTSELEVRVVQNREREMQPYMLVDVHFDRPLCAVNKRFRNATRGEVEPLGHSLARYTCLDSYMQQISNHRQDRHHRTPEPQHAYYLGQHHTARGGIDTHVLTLSICMCHPVYNLEEALRYYRQ
eukprot:jgi/Bigna1/79852/fgenesh1_pg.65_\